MSFYLGNLNADILFEINQPLKREVFLGVYSFTNNGRGVCFASQRAIANKIKCSQDTVKRLLPDLVKEKYLKMNGSRSVRGGIIPIYVLGERWSFTKTAKVNDTASEVNDTAPTESYKGKLASKPLAIQDKNTFFLGKQDYSVTDPDGWNQALEKANLRNPTNLIGLATKIYVEDILPNKPKINPVLAQWQADLPRLRKELYQSEQNKNE